MRDERLFGLYRVVNRDYIKLLEECREVSMAYRWAITIF